MIAELPKPGSVDETLLARFEEAKEIIAGVRTIRLKKQIANKTPLTLNVEGSLPEGMLPVIEKMANLQEVEKVAEKNPTAMAFRVGATQYSVPLSEQVDPEEELCKLEADRKHYEGFLVGVKKKLANERFVANAPEAVVALERKKEADATAKLEAIDAAMKALQNR